MYFPMMKRGKKWHEGEERDFPQEDEGQGGLQLPQTQDSRNYMEILMSWKQKSTEIPRPVLNT